MLQQGIIIRSFLPRDTHVIIFDRIHGRFSARTPQQSCRAVVQGSLAQYYLRQAGKSIVIEAIETIHLPAIQLRENLKFVHHVLEILRMFLPDYVRADEVFNHCIFLYHEDAKIIAENLRFQYFFLLKLFSLLGVFPEEEVFNQCKLVHAILAQSFEALLAPENKIPLDVLHAWLLGCIHTHHHVKIFTTLAMY